MDTTSQRPSFMKGILPHLCLALLALIATDVASAAAPSFFTPSAGDKSIKDFLTPIFGTLFGGSGSTPLMELFKTLNAAALTIGGMLAAYTLVAGTMQTAHDGEMLGKKWSSMWLPIRTALGVGLVVPVNGGYCVAQLIVGWLAIQGIGLADQLWSAFAKASFTQTGMTPASVTPNVSALAEKLLKNMVCLEAGNLINQSGDAAKNINSDVYKAKEYTMSAFADLTPGIPWGTGAFNGRLYGYNGNSVCGNMNFQSIHAPSLEGNIYSGITMNTADRGVAAAIVTAHKTAAVAMETRLQTLAKEIVRDGGAPNVAEIAAAAQAYQVTVNAAAQNIFGNGNDAFKAVKDSATADGWIMAGAWFMRIAALQDVMNRATSSTATVVAPQNVKDPAFLEAYSKYDGVIGNNPSSLGFSKANVSHEVGSDWIKDIALSLTSSMSNAFKIDPNRHPVMAAKDLGDTVMGGTETAIVAAIGIMTVASGTTLGTMAAPLMFVGTLFLTLFLPLFAFGAGLSVYIPMVPFIIFFGAALGWLLLVAEAVIAAPLWAVMHLTPSGDDVMGGARHGYMLLLGLMLRPALLIFGFAICLVAIEPVLKFYNLVFFPVFFASMGDSLVGVVTMMVGLGIYFGTLTFFIHKIFALIHVIPDQLLQWIGGGGSQLGQYGGGASEAGKAAKMAMAGAVVQGSGSLSQGASTMGGNMQRARMEEQGRLSTDSQQMQGKMAAEKMGGISAAGDAGTALGTHDQAMSTGNSAKLAQSARENSQAANKIEGQQQNMESAAKSAEAQAAKLGEKSISGQAMRKEAKELREEAAGLQPAKERAEKLSEEAFEALSGKATQAMTAARAPSATRETKETAAAVAGMAANAANSIQEGSPGIGAKIGAPAAAAKFSSMEAEAKHMVKELNAPTKDDLKDDSNAAKDDSDPNDRKV